jgi:hypothetical protein
LPVHTDPQKVSPVFMDPLADALRHAAKWLKSSWKGSSRKFALLVLRAESIRLSKNYCI